MSRADRLALLLCLITVGITYLVSVRVFENIPHLEDEIAYVWQARVMADGRLALPSPPHQESFLIPFVVDYNGLRFSKYPPGWSALLAVCVRLGVRGLVNPILAGLCVWLTYRLGKKMWGEVVGLLAAVLTLTSPFFLMNAGSLLSHPLGLALSAAFAPAWLDATAAGRGDQTSDTGKRANWLRDEMPAILAGLSLGFLTLTRPFTAVSVAVPFGLHGLYLLARGDGRIRRRVITVGAFALVVGGETSCGSTV